MTFDAFEARLAQVLPSNVAFAFEDPQAAADGIYAEESEHIARMIGKRQREFAAGRRAARRALRQLSVAATPLLVGESRVPAWPTGTTGSISHCSDACVAITARASDVRSIGVDVENARGLKAELVSEICTPHEIKTQVETAENPLKRAKQIFSAKEAAFKAQFMLTRKMLGFGAMEIEFLECDGFRAYFCQPETEFEDHFEGLGTSITTGQHVMHLMILP